METRILKYSEIEAIKVDVPEGQKGNWKIERFEISQKDADWHNMRCQISMGGIGRGRTIKPGTYTRLIRNGNLIMSDTPAEKMDHFNFIYEAKGDVLVNGLGVGWIIEVLLQIPQVTSITIVEISQDLIDLVGPHYQSKCNGKLNIICADALIWKPPKGKRYNAVWHDIWNNICADNLDEMKKLHRKYGRRSDWQGSWCREECKA